jgi:lipopolysaccharide transport system permease protein
LKIPATAILFPLVLLPFATLTLGLSWLLAATGVFLRDLGQVVGLASTILLFLSPVFYPISAVPVAYQPLLRLNPLTFVIEQSRNVLIWGRSPDWAGLGIYSIAALAVAWLGFWWFQKTRPGFADVL